MYQLSAQGDALTALNDAMTLAQPEGYRSVFVEEGPEVLALLRRGEESGMWSCPPLKDYVGGIRSAFSGSGM